jgi:acetolactate synthase I/III small subunit
LKRHATGLKSRRARRDDSEYLLYKKESVTGMNEVSDTHTISLYVANKPGVLARIAQVFARRGFNIDSLVVSSALDGDYSRMTVTAKGNIENLDQIIKQVSKLIDVIHCLDHTSQNVVSKEMALVKVMADSEERTEVLQIADHFNCKTVDLTDVSMIIMATGDTEKVDAFVGMMQKYKIVEIVRTGKVIMARGQDAT